MFDAFGFHFFRSTQVGRMVRCQPHQIPQRGAALHQPNDPFSVSPQVAITKAET